MLDMFMVIAQSRTSYRTNKYIEMAIWLTEQGYKTEDPRTAYEYLRLRKGSSQVILYFSGSLILQGGDVETPRGLIQTLIEPAETADLPF